MSEREGESSVVAENGKTKNRRREELFQCGVWTFPWLMSASLFRLAVYLNKLYQDSSAVSVYYNRGEVNYCIISISCLLIPPFVYMIYLVWGHVKREDSIKKSEVGAKVIDGLLLIPWQIKSIVEVLHFSVQRVCQRRSPCEEEKDEQSMLDYKAMILGFFEDFFAGFIQLVLQISIILIYYNKVAGKESKTSKSFDLDSALYGEIVASVLTLISMLLAVRQKDDGLASTFLSFFGWASIMGSRAFTIALAASVIHVGIIGFCLLHAVVVTLWLLPICWRTYSETQLSKQKKCATTFLLFFLFGLPSLIYWPILFHLKANRRPLIFLAIIIIENIGLFCIWYFMKEHRHWDSITTMSVAITAGGTCVGCILILCYIRWKPMYTDQIVLHDTGMCGDTNQKAGTEDFFGIYYDFFEVTFQLQLSKFVKENLQLVRKH